MTEPKRTKVDEAVWAYRLAERLAPSAIAEERVIRHVRRLNSDEFQEYVERTVAVPDRLEEE